MAETRCLAKFSPSPDICFSCTRLLLSELKDPVLLHESIFSLEHSSKSCCLCQLIWRGLTGFSTVKNGPRSACYLFHLVNSKPGQRSEIWGRRQLVDYTSFGMNPMKLHLGAKNCPISFIEVMMIQARNGVAWGEENHTSSEPESGKLKNAVWGLSCDPAVVLEAGGCPYLWEYRNELRDVGRLDDLEISTHYPVGHWYHTNTPMELFSSTRPSDVWWGKG